jgi:hypothetical protein
MTYERVGAIKDVSGIPFNEHIIVTGTVDRKGWMWHMGGIFKKRENGIVFENMHGMVTNVEEDKINLTVLRKV